MFWGSAKVWSNQRPIQFLKRLCAWLNNVKQKTWNYKIVPAGSKRRSKHDVRSSLIIHTCLPLSTCNSRQPREPKQPRFDNCCLGQEPSPRLVDAIGAHQKPEMLLEEKNSTSIALLAVAKLNSRAWAFQRFSNSDRSSSMFFPSVIQANSMTLRRYDMEKHNIFSPECVLWSCMALGTVKPETIHSSLRVGPITSRQSSLFESAMPGIWQLTNWLRCTGGTERKRSGQIANIERPKTFGQFLKINMDKHG